MPSGVGLELGEGAEGAAAAMHAGDRTQAEVHFLEMMRAKTLQAVQRLVTPGWTPP